MNKFKVGDRVKVTKAYGYAVEGGLKAGDVTEIIGDRLEMNGYGRQAYYLKSPEQGRYDFSTFKAPDGRWGLFLPDEIKLVKDEKPKQKHILIRVDKPIEVGDLVRCIEDDNPCKVGDIRKVRSVYRYLDLFITTQLFTMYQESWEVVHKLKVGDLVVFDARIKTVTGIKPDSNQFYTTDGPFPYTAYSCFELYQPKKHDPNPKTEADINTLPVEPVNYGLNKTESVSFSVIDEIGRYQTAWSEAFHEMTRDINQRKNMKRQVAEMVVELMDQETTISLGAYPDIGLTMVEVLCCGQSIGEAELHPNDTWDTLIGVYVALSKATGRDLPDWIYEKEDPYGIS